MLTDAAAALDLTARVVAIPVALGAVEILIAGRELRPGGLLDWSVSSLVRPRRRVDRLLRSPRLRSVLSPRGALTVAALELMAGIALAVLPRLPFPALIALFCHGILLRRHHQSVEGSDDMIMVVLLALTLRDLSSAATVQQAAAAFLAAQVALSYLTSGLSKMQGREWWDGTGLPRTLSTRYFGHRLASAALWRFRPIALLASWATFLLETAFVLALVGPSWVALVAVAALGALHVSCAVVMGLSQFVWAFAATYPCVLVTNAWLGAHLEPSLRLTIALAATAVLAGAGGLFTGGALAARSRFSPTPERRRSPAPQTFLRNSPSPASVKPRA